MTPVRVRSTKDPRGSGGPFGGVVAVVVVVVAIGFFWLRMKGGHG